MTENNILPLVSIIIPVYNSENTIGACLEKLLDQTYPSDRIQIIAVNNNSTDKTQSIIDKYNIICIFEKKRGPSAARNAGIRKASGEIIIFIDADCLADHDFVYQHVAMHKKIIAENINFKIIGGGVDGINKNYWSLCDDFLNWYYCSSLLPPREENLFLPTANLSVRRDVLIKENIFFDENLFPGEDVDLCFNLKSKGYKIYFHPEAKVNHINRTTLKGVFNHCFAWLRPEFDFRKKNIRPYKIKPKILWILCYVIYFFKSLTLLIINSFQTRRYFILLCLPVIISFHLVLHYNLFKIDMKYGHYLKQKSYIKNILKMENQNVV